MHQHPQNGRKVTWTVVCLDVVLPSKSCDWLCRWPMMQLASLTIRSTVRFSKQRGTTELDLTPDLPALLWQTSGWVKGPSWRDTFHPLQGGCNMICCWEPSLLAAAPFSIKTAERERDWRLSDSSNTRIPTGRTHPRDWYSHVAGKHLSLKWWLSLLSLTAGGCISHGGWLAQWIGGNVFLVKFCCFTGTTFSNKEESECSQHNLSALDSHCSAQ